MDIVNILGIGIVGAALSGIMELVKKYTTSTPNINKLVVIALALVIGTGYYYLQGTQLLTTILAILGVSQTIYGLLLKK